MYVHQLLLCFALSFSFEQKSMKTYIVNRVNTSHRTSTTKYRFQTVNISAREKWTSNLRLLFPNQLRSGHPPMPVHHRATTRDKQSRIYGESMRTPHRKALEPGTTVLITALGMGPIRSSVGIGFRYPRYSWIENFQSNLWKFLARGQKDKKSRQESLLESFQKQGKRPAGNV